MRSLSIVLAAGYPADRENRQPAQYFLADQPWTSLTRDLVWGDPWIRIAQAQVRSEGARLVFKQLVRSCRRWQLFGLQVDLRGDLRLGMHLRVRDPRRSHVAPGERTV